jgi:hypothetical protein
MRNTTLLFLGSLGSVIVVAAFVGCGGSGTTSQCDPGCTGPESTTSGTSAGSTTTGGSGGAGGAGGASSASSASSAASTSGSTGTGSGVSCGGKQGKMCLSTEYCDFPADACSLADESGSCTLRPVGCPDIYAPTCGCDGLVHTSACDAAAAGTDINLNGTCTPPTGKFACGSGFCDVGISYCERDTSDVGGVPSSYQCKPLPPSCGLPATCACLANVQCGSMCAASADGTGLVVTCPGG